MCIPVKKDKKELLFELKQKKSEIFENFGKR